VASFFTSSGGFALFAGRDFQINTVHLKRAGVNFEGKVFGGERLQFQAQEFRIPSGIQRQGIGSPYCSEKKWSASHTKMSNSSAMGAFFFPDIPACRRGRFNSSQLDFSSAAFRLESFSRQHRCNRQLPAADGICDRHK
jgi:hypothetical protein